MIDMNVRLNKTNQKKFVHNVILFLRPVAVLYLVTVIGTISPVNHVITVNDFIPNAFAQGGIVLYFLNAALDYFRKLEA